MWCCRPCPHRFLSTPSARRATREIIHAKCATQISIHALREEGDGVFERHLRHNGISIHALREEGDGKRMTPIPFREQFLSTPSARRATPAPPGSTPSQTDFYPRPPRGGRRGMPLGVEPSQQISIHALREEGDFANLGEQAILKKISIHALREEGDSGAARPRGSAWYFYSRPPRGGRRITVMDYRSFVKFLFTPSARRATPYYIGAVAFKAISIHALREEGDSKNRDKISIFKQIIQHSARI